MPALKDLSIIIDYPRSSEIDLPLEAFTGASHVTTLNLTPICHLTLPHPWPLTNLTIDCGQDNGACYSPCIGTILACKNTLRTCTILSEFGRMLALQHSPREPTKFPCLETLDLRQAAMDFCELIACPNLRSLRLSAWTLPESVRPFEAAGGSPIRTRARLHGLHAASSQPDRPYAQERRRRGAPVGIA